MVPIHGAAAGLRVRGAFTPPGEGGAVTLHCRRCQCQIGEIRDGWVRLGCGQCSPIRVRAKFKMHCERCGHTWWEGAGRGGYDGDVPRTSGA